MRSVVALLAALAAALGLCGVEPALADEAGQEAAARALLFAGTDFWRNGGFTHGGFLWAYQGLDAEGPVLKLLFGGGVYRYHAGATEITGNQILGSALPGWRFKRDALEVTVFAGLDAQEHRFAPADPGNRLAGVHVGARGGFDVWYEPAAGGMLTASVSLSTVGMGYWTRAAAGLRAFDTLWLGPEVHASGDDSYSQFRAGAHITSLRIFASEWSAGAGWVTDSDRRSGVYGRVGVLVRR
jgi:hypothetical protein